MAKRKVAGPGRLGTVKAVKNSLKSKGNSNVRMIPKEDSLTVRFLDEPEEWHGFYEHYVDNTYQPCTTDDCVGCESDDPEEQRRSFRYLANAYVVDDQKVRALKMPKSLVESLMAFYTKYHGTIMDRDYELSRTGSGQLDTKYMAIPEAPTKMKLSRFKDQKHDLDDILESMVVDNDDLEDEDEEDDEPIRRPKKKGKPKKSAPDPWDDDEDDDDDEDEDETPVRRKKKSAPTKSKSSKSASAKRRTVKRK